jgi:hypothetical protein
LYSRPTDADATTRRRDARDDDGIRGKKIRSFVRDRRATGRSDDDDETRA